MILMQAENTLRVFKTEESRTANCRHGLIRCVKVAAASKLLILPLHVERVHSDILLCDL